MSEVNLQDFAIDRLGGNDVADLAKSMTAGQIQGGAQIGTPSAGIGNLMMESLDKTIKALSFKESDLVFWRQIPQKTAYSTVEEFVQQKSYGSKGGAFFGEGNMPLENDGSYVRQMMLMKYLGRQIKVSHQSTLVQQIGGTALQKATNNGTLDLMREGNAALFHGNSRNVGDEFDGIFSQHRAQFANLETEAAAGNVFDLRGRPLEDGDLEDGTETILQANGTADTFFAPPSVLNDYSKSVNKGRRTIADGTSQEVVLGQRVNKFASQFGDIRLQFDKFMRLGSEPKKLTYAPARPTLVPGVVVADGVAPVAAVADPLSRFGGYTGDYLYAVAAINAAGEGALQLLKPTLTAVAAGQSIDLKFTAAAGTQATAFTIYRTTANPVFVDINDVEFYPIFTVPVAALVGAGYDGAAIGLVRDRNRDIAGTEKAFLLQFDEEVLEYAKLLPLMRVPLAQIDLSTRYALVMYGAPMGYAMGKVVVYKNIGRRANAA
jgi:hypothetical protein